MIGDGEGGKGKHVTRTITAVTTNPVFIITARSVITHYYCAHIVRECASGVSRRTGYARRLVKRPCPSREYRLLVCLVSPSRHCRLPPSFVTGLVRRLSAASKPSTRRTVVLLSRSPISSNRPVWPSDHCPVETRHKPIPSHGRVTSRPTADAELVVGRLTTTTGQDPRSN